jgi:tripartite-type tricarboxylate transporter receptor subunit TctC
LLGFSPGSASHNVAQLIVPGLAAYLGRPVELELHPGESGKIAARMVAAAKPDGNTLLIATLGTHALVPAIDPDCGYHPLNDFAPISLLFKAPLILAVPSSSGIGDLAALIEAARKADPALTYGSSAVGGAPHLAAELFARRAGVALRHVRYSDTRELYNDLVAGRIDLSFNNIMSMLPLIRAEKLVPLGTTGALPHPDLVDVPTIASIGLDHYQVTNWLGIVGPAGLLSALIAEINNGLTRATHTTTPANGAFGIVTCSAEEFDVFLRNETDRWVAIIRELGQASLQS